MTNKLFTLLSAYYALECKVRNYHWDVECHHFTEYHKFFEEEYNTISAEIDEIAEQIRKLGSKVSITLEKVVNECKKNNIDLSNSAIKSSDMILCLIDSNNKIIEMIKDLKLEMEGNRDYMGASILMDDLLKTREKDLWFLKSLSK